MSTFLKVGRIKIQIFFLFNKKAMKKKKIDLVFVLIKPIYF